MASSSTNFHEVTSPDHFKTLLSEDLNRVSLLNFWAPWAAPCAQMNEVVLELAKKYPDLLVLQIEAEGQADIAESFDVEAVPSFVILRVRRRHGSLAYITFIFYSRDILFLDAYLVQMQPG